MAAANKELTVHFPVAAEPSKVLKTLRTLEYAEEPIRSAKELDDLSFEQNTDTNRFDEARGMAQGYLGLIEMTREGYILTPRAQVILKKRENIQYDLLHYLFTTAWTKDQPTLLMRSWFYRVLCERLWAMQEITVDLETRRVLTHDIDNQIRIDFEDVEKVNKVSFGRQCIDGAIRWLRGLSPAVMDEATEKRTWQFHRRAVCSPELFLLALGHSYRTSGTELHMDVLLSAQRREEICRLCLLDPVQFDRMLDLVFPLYPNIVTPGTRSGSYGRFVRLHLFPTVENI